jgi:hypothetical protein
MKEVKSDALTLTQESSTACHRTPRMAATGSAVCLEPGARFLREL